MSYESMTNEQLQLICKSMKIAPLADRFIELSQTPEFMADKISCRELVSELVTALRDSRASNRINRELRNLGLLGTNHSLENMNFKDRCGLSRRQMQELLSCEFIRAKQPVIITGQTGIGKAWISSLLIIGAILQKLTCHKEKLSSFLARLADLDMLTIQNEIKRLCTYDLVVLNKFGDHASDMSQIRIIAELLEGLQGKTAFILTGQTEFSQWMTVCFNEHKREMASAMDYLQSSALRFHLTGKSLRGLYQDGPELNVNNSGGPKKGRCERSGKFLSQTQLAKNAEVFGSQSKASDEATPEKSEKWKASTNFHTCETSESVSHNSTSANENGGKYD